MSSNSDRHRRRPDSKAAPQEVRTAQHGQFTLQVEPGLCRLRVLHPGFAPTVTELLRVRDDDATLRIIVRLPASSAVRGEGAYALAPVVVEGRPVARHLVAFQRRRVVGLGDFVTRDEFEVWRPQEVMDILRRMPSFVVRANPSFGRRMPDGSVDTRRNLIESRGLSTRRTFECPPLIFLDGAFVGDSRTFDAEMIPIDAVDAVEAYSRPAQVPLELNRDGAQCGVVAFWTRQPDAGAAGRSRIEMGLRYGGSVSDGEFGWGRLGLHMVARLVGPLELYPAFHVIVNVPSPGPDLSNSGWHAQLALRVRPLASLGLWYLGTGVGVSEVARRVRSVPVERESVNVAHAMFTGIAVRIGPLSPFLEAHLIDVFTFSNLEGRLYLGVGARL